MADDLTKRGGEDRKRISLTEEWEIRDWCDKFGVNEAQLRGAVDQVGDRAEDVEQFLGGDCGE